MRKQPQKREARVLRMRRWSLIAKSDPTVQVEYIATVHPWYLISCALASPAVAGLLPEGDAAGPAAHFITV